MDPVLEDLDRRIDARFGGARWPERATCRELESELSVFRRFFEPDEAGVRVFWDALRSFARSGVFTVEEAERGLHLIYKAIRQGAALITFEMALGGEFLSDVGPRILKFVENLPATLEGIGADERGRVLSRWERWLEAPPEYETLDFDGFLEILADPEPPTVP